MKKHIQFILAFVFLFGSLSLGVAETLVIDPATSRIEVAVSATIDSFVGVLEKYECSVEVQPSNPLPTKADVKFDFKDFKTGNVKRDAAMLDWMTYTNNPGATFCLTGWKKDGDRDLAVGEFTLHGVKKTIEMPVQVKAENGQWTITGSADINHVDYGLKKIRKFALLTVDPKLKISFVLHLKPAVEPSKK
jgi:polyisoprenoid-binding protein YceI